MIVAQLDTTEFRRAVAHVQLGHAGRITMPGCWTVWMPEGGSKPRARIFQSNNQGDATCRCSR